MCQFLIFHCACIYPEQWEEDQDRLSTIVIIILLSSILNLVGGVACRFFQVSLHWDFGDLRHCWGVPSLRPHTVRSSFIVCACLCGVSWKASSSHLFVFRIVPNIWEYCKSHPADKLPKDQTTLTILNRSAPSHERCIPSGLQSTWHVSNIV